MSDLEKIYKGSYTYYELQRSYSEENFMVFKNSLDGSYRFESEILTRVANGEFLKVKVLYTITKDYIPLNIVIDKALGSQNVQEFFVINQKEQSLTYTFITADGSKDIHLGLPPKFYIATPAACTSFLFFLTKKFDPNGKNFYSIITCQNMWELDDEPEQRRIYLEAPQTSQMNIKIGENALTANQYNMYDETDDAKMNPISFYTSKHLNIPYRIVGANRTKIEVNYLNHLENDNVKLM